MLTLDDINKLTQILATKQDIEDLPSRDEFNDFKNDVFNKMDSTYKEVLI